MKHYDRVVADNIIDRTVEALSNNGFVTHVVANKKEAKELTLGLIPKGAEVFTNLSTTLDIMGITNTLNG